MAALAADLGVIRTPEPGMKTHGSLAVAMLGLAVAGCSRSDDAGALPTPRQPVATDSICQQPTPASDFWMPDCEIPGDPCKGSTLVVEVSANGAPGRAHVMELQSEAVDACLSRAVHEWVFIAAQNCAGAPVAGVWKQQFSAVCGDTLGTDRARPSPSPAPRGHR
jgi:hypothetical protein